MRPRTDRVRDTVSLSHLTLGTRDVEQTASFFERTFGYTRGPIPGNSPRETQWLEIGRGQQFHITFVDGFEVSPFEGEFGRHVAIFHPLAEFTSLKDRLTANGATFIEPGRTTPFERFFFREPVNGYVFEVIDEARKDRDLVSR
jgi:catechol 2,3-dioxygenase-like lactoylglutathione lyase family enzyme